ncbi:hypothetical protein CDL15_Pgr024445 [Punica granatum]|uniref:mRNA export factor GLE1 n=1 Tax=Punica granatum TaxID=22663 RepID=A0A218XXB2_PUNGR|nr:hypothetical protein CDL15_Pgr024445 [Punica granatum]
MGSCTHRKKVGRDSSSSALFPLLGRIPVGAGETHWPATKGLIRLNIFLRVGASELRMGGVRLELRCPRNVHGVSLDPDPDWSFDALLSELSAVEKKLNASSPFLSAPFSERQLRNASGRTNAERSPVAFRMCLAEDDEIEEAIDQRIVARNRFECHEVYLSDESDEDSPLEGQPYLMDEVGLVEGSLFELNHDYQFGLKEEVRNHVSTIERDLLNENEKSTAALIRVRRYRDARWDTEKRMDTQYHRKIAEGLDNHLTDIQREYELKSQIEERRIRNDAAHEEAKRKALYEEKLRQEKAKAEAEARVRAEEARKKALEAERKAKEAADKEAAEKIERDAAMKAQKEQAKQRVIDQSKEAQPTGIKKPESAGDIVKAAKSALNLEQARLQRYKEIEENNQALRLNKDFSSKERHIVRLIKQIRGIKDNVRAKATELVKIFNDPSCPQSISIVMFAKKVVSLSESPDTSAFAWAHVIVLIASKVPQVMDFLLAELHRVCIFTVPKYVMYSKPAFESREAHYKSLGFKEDNGKIESVNDYLKRLESYIRLYGALVQTEVEGVQNPHGLAEGWAWLARFLNALPANIYTAVTLKSFLQMAGYALYRKYKSQFGKILNVISENYLAALKARDNSELNPVIAEIQSYIEDKKFLQVPEGRVLQGALLSREMVPESDYRESYNYPSNRYYY